MTNNDPFGFDISAASDKKRRTKGRRGMSGAFETSTRRCDKEGCSEPGQYRAPKSPRALDDYYWFCKEHVREYNLNWNYFQGQSEAEFQQFLDNATVWERPTKPFGKAQEQALLNRALSQVEGFAHTVEIAAATMKMKMMNAICASRDIW